MFNIIINGVGGQGIITLQKILAQAALTEGFDIKTSELHGLAQRGGSVESQVRFGKEVFSPLIREGGADLVISLEAQEALKAAFYASKKNRTVFLINDFFLTIPNEKLLTRQAILKSLNPFSSKVIFLPASEICQKNFKTDVVSGIYLLGCAVFKKLLPFKITSLISAIKKIIPENYLELNLKALNLAKGA